MANAKTIRFRDTSEAKTITEAALLKRINRWLAHQNQVVRKARRWTTDLGWFYVVDSRSGNVEAAHRDDLRVFARDGGLTKPGKRMESGPSSTEVR